ncbi:MAG: hypothetical protein OXP73_00365 [Chloroflexota bacterium]|nr:hypothetical protein [Chloroflexota bacterium]
MGQELPADGKARTRDRFESELFQSETGSNVCALRFLGRILKRAWADIVKASNTSVNTRANKIDKLTGGMGDQINMGSS